MSSLKSTELLAFLVCPLCKRDLAEFGSKLKCTYCAREYGIRNGIPLLYPDTIDFEHLREEENLAKMMKNLSFSKKDQTSLIQWEKSKQEFWDMVQGNIGQPPKAFINIGCGYDNSFSILEKNGYMFINFDIVYDMLYDLQTQHGSKFCVAGDINYLPFRKHSFDYVVSIDVIHHEYDKAEALLRSFHELLKPGGILFLEDPNAWGMFQFIKSAFLPRPLYRSLRSWYHKLKNPHKKPADYEYALSIWAARRMLKDLSFTNITAYSNNAYPEWLLHKN
ncbi:MAG: methyltransferase domain-containing protein [bacterium]